MSGLLMLVAMIIASVGIAALILMLIEVIVITLPEMLMQTVKGNSELSVPSRKRSTDQNKARSYPFC